MVSFDRSVEDLAQWHYIFLRANCFMGHFQGYFEGGQKSRPIPPIGTGTYIGDANTKKIWDMWLLVLPVCTVTPMYWWYSACSAISHKGFVMLAAQALIDRSMTNYWAGVSGKGNRIIPRWRPTKKRKGHLSPRFETNIYNLPPSCPPLFLTGHYL